MLLIQPRKRSRALDHATTHPASWQTDTTDSLVCEARTFSRAESSSPSTVCDDGTGFSTTSIAALDLHQLQQLSVLISERIQIRKRYNNTPLRRIIARQVSTQPVHGSVKVEEDRLSQTDTLLGPEAVEVEIAKESPEAIKARYNDTPLRRILSRQVSVMGKEARPHDASGRVQPAREPVEVRKRRYNNTPLRRILSGQATLERPREPAANIVASPSLYTVHTTPSTPVPRSNTPLRRILTRQVSAHSVTLKEEDDELSDRADSVISLASPTLSRQTPAHLSSLEDHVHSGLFSAEPPSPPSFHVQAQGQVHWLRV